MDKQQLHLVVSFLKDCVDNKDKKFTHHQVQMFNEALYYLEKYVETQNERYCNLGILKFIGGYVLRKIIEGD